MSGPTVKPSTKPGCRNAVITIVATVFGTLILLALVRQSVLLFTGR